MESKDLSYIVPFLCRAKRCTYAGHGAELAPSRPASHDLRYVEGELEYYDSYLGSERFGGEEAVWEGGCPLWVMNYQGRVLDSLFSGDFLKAALSAVGPELPYRGPELYQEADTVYHCHTEGNFFWFWGREEIYVRGKRVYECLFHGGAIG